MLMLTEGWISVNDKLPPINGCSYSVLIYIISRKCIVIATRYSNARYAKKYHWRFYEIDGSVMIEPNEVSHWMPLPKNPII